MNKERLELFYFKHYKKLMLIPIFILLLGVGYLTYFYSQTGDLFYKDVSLKGGVSATVYTEQEATVEEIHSFLGVDASIRRLADFSSGKQLGFIVEVSDLSADQLEPKLEEFFKLELTTKNYSVEETGSKLGAAFTKQLLIAILFAFILMAITVFITFRTFAPSLAVVFAAFMNITIPLAIINFMGMKLSSAGIIGFLLIIGYSVDTDILLTTWALKKREKSLFERMFHSMKTGLTMTAAAIAVMIIGIIFSNVVVIREMFIVILLALITDIFATYLTNAGILTWYCQKKGIR
ncbi:MAG: hypothetical protein WC595_06400 [Candidatus Nanoarchaeia archaeon]